MTYGLPKSNDRENSRVSPFVQLMICTFGILVLELAIIRWMSSQIRIVAYFSNVVLLASFLGMGLGVALGRRRPSLVHYCLPALTILSLVLAFSRPMGLMNLSFPDPSLSLWGQTRQRLYGGLPVRRCWSVRSFGPS